MDLERERIQEDLRGLVDGDVRCDDVFLQLYASDASIYQIRPLGVVRPRSAAEVSAIAQYAAKHRISLHARGAGSGLAGESLGRGLVLDFSRYMRRIVRTDAASVCVQPGVVHGLLNRHLQPSGRVFGPDPSNSEVTTMGSVLAIDASGSHWPQYGAARSSVESLQIVLADGSVIEAGRELLTESNLAQMAPVKRDLVARLVEVLSRETELIQRFQPKTKHNRSGYQINDVLADGHLNLAKLIVGSEGTLALITEATVATQPIPASRGVALLFFDRLENATLAVQEILPLGFGACDLLDRRHLSLARESNQAYNLLIPPDAEALLIVEMAGDDAVEVRARLSGLVDKVRRKKRLAFETRQAYGQAEIDTFWQLARRVVPTLHRVKGSSRPLPFVEDLAVPPEVLPDFLIRLQNTLKRHQVTASLYGHVGHGQLHVRPFMDLANADDIRKMEELAADLYHEVLDVGGTISGEHGDGLSRTAFVQQQYGDLYKVFRDVKWIFDPLNILNPGKIVGDDPGLMTRDLRPMIAPTETVPATPPGHPPSANGETHSSDAVTHASAVPQLPLVSLQLTWSQADADYSAQQCNGCGGCRSQSSEVRMCPTFRAGPAEEASPRAKANLMRGVLSGQLDPTTLTNDEFKTVADLCVNCHMCRLECPAGVDIPKLMMEGKGAYVGTNGLKMSDYLLSRIDMLSDWGSMIAPLMNWALRNRQARWLIEKTLGIAQGRKLPRFSSRSFMRRAARKRLTTPTRRSGRKVLYFVDTFAWNHDPQLGEACVAVMEHNGVSVYVHPDQRASGMAMISIGALDAAKKIAKENVAILSEAVRQGYHIIASEPSAALCLTHEYLNLLDDDDARLVAANSSEACTYLWKLHQTGELQLDLRPINFTLGYHMPCHLRALGVGSPGENLLRLIPGLKVSRIDKGCSGMAGTYGLKRQNYRQSLRAGWGLISSLRSPAVQAGTTECSSCKIQMEQGTIKPTIHPLKLLALAYGLMPELEDLLTRRGRELVIT